MAGKQCKISTRHMECPVCLDIYSDPRSLPCAHTLCRDCIHGLIEGGSLTCPVCRAQHNTAQAGADGFKSNFLAAGMIDSMCKGCRSAEPEGQCPHCEMMLCADCQRSHLVFDDAKQTLKKVGTTITQGKDAANTSEIRKRCARIEESVNLTINSIVEQWEQRRKTLLSEVRRIRNNDVTSRQAWIERLNVRLRKIEADLATLTSRLGDAWGDHITEDGMSDVNKQGEKMIDEIKQFLATIPDNSKPTFTYDDTDAQAAIRSFGLISPPPVSCFESKYTGRPRVVGEVGSGPGQFSCPRDVAVCPVTGRIMVADVNNQRVQVLDDDFTHIMDIRAAGQRGGLWPWCVAVTRAGDVIVSYYMSNLAVCYSGSNQVSVYSGAGIHLCDLPGPWSCPLGITVDGDDNIYVCDRDTSAIRVFSSSHQPIRTLGGEGTGPGQFSDPPWYIAARRDDVIISDTAGRLHVFSITGEFIEKLDPGTEHEARGLTVDPSGDLVIAYDEGPVTVLRDNRETRRVGESGDETWQLGGTRGVAVTKAGQIVVANTGHNNLLVYKVET